MKTKLIEIAKEVLTKELNQLKAFIQANFGMVVSICLTIDNPHLHTLLSLIFEIEMVNNEDEEKGLVLAISVLTYDPCEIKYTPLKNKIKLICDISNSTGRTLKNLPMEEIDLENEEEFKKWVDNVKSFINSHKAFVQDTLRENFS